MSTRTPLPRNRRRRSSDDGGFRLVTALFAVLVLAIVAGIGFELFRHSSLPIR
jgi:hypothetical protein